jgi:hypothetical protein
MCLDITGKTKDNFKARREGRQTPLSIWFGSQRQKTSDEMDEKIEIPQWLCCRIEMMCECEGRENSWVKEP